VHGGEHEVPGERRLRRHQRRLVVAHLADEHHVRVLAEDRAQRRGEGEPGALVRLHLHHAGQAPLDRVLDGDHVDAAAPEHPAERGVERGGLPRARGAGDEHEPLARVEQPLEPFLVGRAEAERVERGEPGVRVEQASTRFSPRTVGSDDTRSSTARRPRARARARPAAAAGRRCRARRGS
jgi:hypothetical protein